MRLPAKALSLVVAKHNAVRRLAAAVFQLRFRVQTEFNQLAKRRVTKLGLGLSPGCLQLLEKMISVGVSRLEHQRALEREEQLMLSEQNLLKCVDVLLERSNVLGTFPIVNEEAFDQMQKKLSPMWPFC